MVDIQRDSPQTRQRLLMLQAALVEVHQLQRASWDGHLKRIALEFLGRPVLDTSGASCDSGNHVDSIAQGEV